MDTTTYDWEISNLKRYESLGKYKNFVYQFDYCCTGTRTVGISSTSLSEEKYSKDGILSLDYSRYLEEDCHHTIIPYENLKKEDLVKWVCEFFEVETKIYIKLNRISFNENQTFPWDS